MRQVRCHQLWWIVILEFALIKPGWSDDMVPVGYQAVARETGIPHSLLYSIALTESGKSVGTTRTYRPWPWTLNVAGQGYFYKSRQLAWRALKKWLDQGESSIDIGLMQVNWRYHEARLQTPWQALDPYFNLRIGAAILQDCYSKRQDWWASVGCYHSPTNGKRAEQYRRRVIARWQRVVNT